MIHSCEREWRCFACRALLGIEHDHQLHLRYKRAEFIVTGSVKATCYRCREPNTISCPQPPAAAPGAVT